MVIDRLLFLIVEAFDARVCCVALKVSHLLFRKTTEKLVLSSELRLLHHKTFDLTSTWYRVDWCKAR